MLIQVRVLCQRRWRSACEPGARHPGGSGGVCVDTEKSLPWRHGAAEPRRRLCLCPAPRRSPEPLCRSRAWRVASLRVVGELSAWTPLQLLWPTRCACAASLGALLPVGGDETVKPAPRKPSLCHLPLSTRVGSARGDLCLLGFQLLQIPRQDLFSSLWLREDDGELTEEKPKGRKTNFLKKFHELFKG